MRNHKKHKHKFRYCEKCNTVFCEQCGKEWLFYGFRYLDQLLEDKPITDKHYCVDDKFDREIKISYDQPY